MLQRIDATAAEEDEGFPHYADPASGAWTRSPAGDWTGGFWVGELWLAAHVTGDDRYRAEALQWAQRLRRRTTSETVFRGFLFWYGAAIGSILLDDPTARAIAVDGARGLAALYNPAARAIPLGSEAEEASDVGHSEANIDGVPGGTPLLVWAARETGDAQLEAIARAHAERHVELCVRDDASVCQSASFDVDTGGLERRYTHKGVHDDSTWTRAQAWAMLGFAQAAGWVSGDFREVANRVSDWWIEHMPDDRVAFWDFDDPRIPRAPRDTSGTAIAAAALLKLGALVPARRDRYRAAAEAMVDALVERHLTPIADSDSRPPGILADGCYNERIGLATSHELIWGDYFLLESLLVLEGRLDPTAL
jgi:unsaturated chondroitin disaccharide hydrolase